MLRAIAFATLFAIALIGVPRTAAGQQAVRLNVKVVLVDASGAATPVPRHTLLVSEDPPSAAPRRIVTAADGTGRLNLLPGRYVVESDQPVAFDRQAYRWVLRVDVVAGRDAVLELTAGNAMVEPDTSGALAATAAVLDVSAVPAPSAVLLRWQDSVITLWTPTRHASGFVVDERGLVATSQRAIGTATRIEVQLTPTIKVTGDVVFADSGRDVAIIRVNPTALASVPPVPLGCALPASPPGDGQDVLTIGRPLRGPADISIGTVRRVTTQTSAADFNLRGISPGGPVFAVDGGLVGITSAAIDNERLRGDWRIVSLDQACAAVLSVEPMMASAPPDGALLPVESTKSIPVAVLEDAALRRAGSLNPYPMSSSDFDIAFITPVLAYAGLRQANRQAMDFSNWADYVRDVPPVLLVRVTPKQTESFWMKLARGALLTQGASLPPITHFKAGFARLRAFCGDAEVTPLHPFRLELRLSEREAIYEGLFAFTPDALGPHCGTVKLVLYSEKDPEKGDTREVDPGVLRQVWQDFAPYRAMADDRSREAEALAILASEERVGRRMVRHAHCRAVVLEPRACAHGRHA